jgi:hypothetical protein
LEYVCKIYSAVRSIFVLIESVNGVISVITVALEKIGITSGIAQGLKPVQTALEKVEGWGTKLTDNSYMEFISKMCAWVACDFGLFNWLSDKDYTENYEGWFSYKREDGTRYQAQTPTGSVFNNDPKRFASDDGSRTSQALEAMSEAGITIFDTDNIVYQFLNLCIPGILQKAHQWRAIQCTYVLCLIEQAEAGIVDEAICDDIKASQECEYLLKIFNFVPFSGLMEMIYDLIATFWASDEAGKVNMAITYACHLTAKGQSAVAEMPLYKILCDLYIKVQNMLDAYAKVQAMFDSKSQYWEFTPDSDGACKDMDKALKRIEKEQEAFRESQDNVVNSSGRTSGYGGTAGTTQGTTGTTTQDTTTTQSTTTQPVGGGDATGDLQ